MIRCTLEEIQQVYADQGCVLLAESYQNSTTVMPYICSCGTKHERTLQKFHLGQRCPACTKLKMKLSQQKYSFEYVATQLAKSGCKLIQYTDMHSPMQYQCACGEVDSVIGTAIAIHVPSRKCKQCLQASYQPKHWRKTPEYRVWKFEVLNRDNFTCVKCGDSKHSYPGIELHAHHLNSPKNEELKYNPDNGVTTCIVCHYNYHDTYGRTDCTQEQFNQFLEETQNVTNSYKE